MTKAPNPIKLVDFNLEKLRRFEQSYILALDRPGDTFTFDGHEWLKAYARYAIEFLKTQLSPEERKAL